MPGVTQGFDASCHVSGSAAFPPTDDIDCAAGKMSAREYGGLEHGS